MPRIPYAQFDEVADRVRDALAGRRRINIFKMIAKAENCAPEVLALGHRMSRGSTLPPLEREVVILRVAHLLGASYQWHEHQAVAARVGLPTSTVDAIAVYPDIGAGALTDRQVALLDFTDAVVTTTTAPQELFDAVRAGYTDSQLVELVLIIGFYGMVGRVMNTFEIELESGDPGTFEPTAG
ncbi:carboxymuconolactone decarboxylase family protein [Nocardioides sp. Iso805N]|uniref:carboxymuconolactone decarboxylase family protein n=1 Tax=Nocardioides sp. Iso805N TaxID=1283287 RepID=UPI00037B23E5|nr:carboxymuconolactone decarboxylase family protein [Nocardioides sp. Iso805N]